jgi:hypothetical protein
MTEFPLPGAKAPVDDAEDNAADPSGPEPAGRTRASVKFPYGDLDMAVSVARAVALHGLDCTQGQLANDLNVDAGKAPYRARVSTAQTFGLVESVKNAGVKLTPLGRRINDPEQEAAGRADAFLYVELYKIIFDLFDGTVLPGDQGLESEMVKAGVPPKQVTKARQAFARSADQAGFFNVGRTRLVRPSGASLGSEGDHDDSLPLPPPPPPADDLEESPLSNALLAALFKKMLPAEGEEFSARERKRFFRALAVNLDVIYGEPDDGELDTSAFGQLYVVGRGSVGQQAPIAAIPQHS